mmetsp:Transcript_150946/g.263787  ORF Transcript_150946/g.263787 Transcript_150946/m.263787 type:complete len:94 (-) Transcript_150946:226-507(-)
MQGDFISLQVHKYAPHAVRPWVQLLTQPRPVVSAAERWSDWNLGEWDMPFPSHPWLCVLFRCPPAPGQRKGHEMAVASGRPPTPNNNTAQTEC